jgi:hypothetical protein
MDTTTVTTVITSSERRFEDTNWLIDVEFSLYNLCMFRRCHHCICALRVRFMNWRLESGGLLTMDRCLGYACWAALPIVWIMEVLG